MTDVRVTRALVNVVADGGDANEARVTRSMVVVIANIDQAVVYDKQASDSFAVSDQLSAKLELHRLPNDTVALQDALVRAVATLRIIADTVSFADELENDVIVTNFTPAVASENYYHSFGVPINRWQEIEFDVLTYGRNLSQLQLTIIDAAGISEIVYSLQDGFIDKFSVGSGVRLINDGYHFVLAPKFGWPQKQFTLKITTNPYGARLIVSGV